MTLEQLLSHTAGLECEDHCRPMQDPSLASRILQERFLQEAIFIETEPPESRKYRHVSKPGNQIGYYSNAGVALASWMMEIAYNKRYKIDLSFADIMKKEIFQGVFSLSAQTVIRPGPTGDCIQSGAGDMTSSVEDLLKVAKRLQQGEASLEHVFGIKWQETMLRPRDLFEHHGLGCIANETSIQHLGLNQECFGGEIRDVSAMVAFPLSASGTGMAAICDFLL